MAQIQTTPNVLANAPCNATLSCTDINRTREFYTNVLGLNVIKQSEEQGIMFGAGDTRLYVYPRGDAPKAENTVCAFQVSDVRKVVDQLTNNGVTFETFDLPGLTTDENGIATMGDDVGAWFKDPDGNIIAINSI